MDRIGRVGNGARIERINWYADPSPKGFKQSHGLMVNYLYDLEQIERNHEQFEDRGTVAASRAVERLLRERPRSR